MDSALLIHRLHFGFTVTFHYLFPQLTMGLAPLIVIFKTLALRRNEEIYNQAARFWARIFGINFVLGVVTGIPMEFQFGTNWSHFSRFAGGVIGQTLAMEGMFAFFLESAFLGLFLYGEKRLSPKAHWWSAVAVFVGSVVVRLLHHRDRCLDAEPSGIRERGGRFRATQQLLAVGAEPLGLVAVRPQHERRRDHRLLCHGFDRRLLSALAQARRAWPNYSYRSESITGCVFSILQLFPTGDGQGRMVTQKQPVTLAAMEALFQDQAGGAAGSHRATGCRRRSKIDNPIVIPRHAELSDLPALECGCEGSELHFRQDPWPDNIPLLYYSYHIMVGLGNVVHRDHGGCIVAAVAGKALHFARWMLWILLLSLPFPYIANTAGWMTAELGRQPWLVYGLMRTADGYSKLVSAGNGMFTLLGFMGMYMVLGILFLFLVTREIEQRSSRVVPGASSTDFRGDCELKLWRHFGLSSSRSCSRRTSFSTDSTWAPA